MNRKKIFIKLIAILLFFSLPLCAFSDDSDECELFSDDWFDSIQEDPDGWDGTSETYGETPSMDPADYDENGNLIDGWDDSSSSFPNIDPETQTYITGADGNIEVISYEDVYDEDGNFIYEYSGLYADDESFKADIESRIAEFFEDMMLKEVEGSLDEIFSRYADALKELNEAKEAKVDGKSLQELEEKVAAIREELDAKCEKFGYEWTYNEKTDFGLITNMYGKAVCHAGDPVVLASGNFIIDDEDLTVSWKMASFTLTRHYSSMEAGESISRQGFLGQGWSSNLESRIISTYAEEYIEAKEKWAAYIKVLEGHQEKIKEYLEEDSECSDIYASINEILFSARETYSQIAAIAEQSQKVAEKNSFVSYGRFADMVKNAGLDYLIFCQDQGGYILFKKTPAGNYCPARGYENISIQLEKNEDGYLVYYPLNGEKRYYSAYGLPLKYIDSQENEILFDYDSSHRVKNILLNGKTALSLFWNGNNLVRAEDKINGRNVDYEFEGGRLLRVKDWENDSKSFAYNSQGLLSRQIKADGSYVSFEYSYIDGAWRTVSTRDEEGNAEYFAYDFPSSSVKYTSPNGKWTLYKYDEGGRIISEKHSDSSYADYVYDSEGRLSSISDSSGRMDFYYDEGGNLLQKNYPDGSFEKWTYREDKIISYTDRDSFTQSYTYDSRGKMTDIFRGSELLCHFDWYDTGFLRESRDCRGKRILYSYDSNGNLVEKAVYASSSFRPSAIEKWTYDYQGRITSYSDYSNKKTLYTYGDHWVKSLDSNGLETKKIYSSRKLLMSKSMKDLRSGEIRSYRYEYDKTKKCRALYLSGVDSRGKTVEEKKLYEYAYDEAAENEEENKAFYEYSPGGRLLRKWTGEDDGIEYKLDPIYGFNSGSREEKGIIAQFDNYDFYPDGKIKSYTDRKGEKSELLMDEFDNIVSIISPKGRTERQYDLSGRILSEKKYSSQGKLIRHDEVFYSDREINLLSASYYSQTLKLNAFGEIISFTDGNGNTSIVERDIEGNLISIKDPYSNERKYEYDLDGNLSKIILPDFSVIDVKDAGESENYSLSSENNLASTSSHSFIYDDYGRLLSWENSLGKRREVNYSDDGSISSIKDFSGLTGKYDYFDSGLSFSLSWGEGDFTAYRYSYDGNLIGASNPYSDFEYEYDLGAMLVCQKDKISGREILYSYDKSRNLTQIKGNRRQIDFTYGKNGEVLSITDSLTESSGRKQLKISFVYDKMGRETLRLYDSGESLKSLYDSDGRLILQVAYNSSLQPIFIEGSVFDSEGRKIYSLNSNMEITAYSYDERGRLSKVLYPYSEELSSQMQADVCDAGLFFKKGELSQKQLNLSSSHYQALEKLAGQIGPVNYQLSLSQVCLAEEYAYDDNNNLILRINPYNSINYRYDSENRLTEWGQGCYALYDGAGNMIEKHSAGKELYFEYSPQNRIVAVRGRDYSQDYNISSLISYDALGRKISSQSSGQGKKTFSYLGFSTMLYSSENTRQPVISSSPLGKSRTSSFADYGAGRYVFIADDSVSTKSTSPESQDSSGTVYPLYAQDGRLISYQNDMSSGEEGAYILFTDRAGSVKASLSPEKLRDNYEYECFGFPVKKTAPFSFCGKVYDSESQLYDFGFRDYESSISSFTSMDPFCDGNNWYSYCRGDPVNYYDKDGLYKKTVTPQDMQDHGPGILLGNGESDFVLENGIYKDYSEYLSNAGCVVTAIAEALTAFTGLPVTNEYINTVKECFSGTNVNWDSVKEVFGLVQETVYQSGVKTSDKVEHQKSMLALCGGMNVDKEKNSHRTAYEMRQIIYGQFKSNTERSHEELSIINSLAQISKSSVATVVTAFVCYQGTNAHYVGIDTHVKSIDGIRMVEIISTSKYDKATGLGSNRKDLGWTVKDGKVYVPISLINRIDTLTKAR
ncbi:MAG: DUF6531 domain-containing protein [Treponema sp.]|nr:DUF6531 domain-containing protein [Treponema sp.]